ARELVPVPPQTERYERFARMVIVVDYKRTTVVKKLLATVNSNNVGAMNLESGQARALAAVELTEKQKDDQNLDILTGFIVMDRNTRIIVVEGLRDGAMKKVVEVVGTVSTKKLKVLFNQELGFSKRLYTDFNLVLKQVKLRQPTLQGLTQRPDLCLPGRGEEEVTRGLNQLMEMKRAERLPTVLMALCLP
ncbi:unnamed protein product, partial [Polarella glacialis]